MATVRKRLWQSGGKTRSAWLADYFDQGGVRRQRTFTTKKAADAFLTQVRHEISEGTHTAASASITVREAADLWLSRARAAGLERSTTKQYDEHVRLHIVPMLGALRLSDLSTPRIQRFADELLQRPQAGNGKGLISRTTARAVLASLKAIIKEAQRKGSIAKNPAAPVSIKLPRRGTIKIRAGRDFPTKAEANLLLSLAAGRWRPLIVAAIFTGMRSSELRGLRWEDVDLDAKVMHVRQRADAWGQMGALKSEAGERDIPMTPMVANVLRE
jgi:integrase